MDFVLGLLERVNESQKAAAAAEKRRVAAEATARRKALEERKRRDKEVVCQDVDRMLHRSMRPKKEIAKRRDVAAKSNTRRKLTPEEVAMKIGDVAPQQQPTAAGLASQKVRKPSGPPKPLPGMEFVERRDRKKEIKVPHTSDYSDLFDDDYLVGIDLKCVYQMKEESAKATEEAKKIIAEHQALKAKRMREAEEISKISEEMKRRGLKEKHKNEWRLKVTNKDWVTVDVPKSALFLCEKARLKAAGMPSQASSAGSAAVGGTSSRVNNAKEVEVDAVVIARKKAALKESILAAMGGTSPRNPRRARSSSSLSERPLSSGTRKRVVEQKLRGHRSDKRSLDDRRSEHRLHDDREIKPSPYENRFRVYNSEEWYDSDDDDSDEDLYGIEALEREEIESARLAALEDKQELQKELQRKKDKERRRREFERSRRK